MKVPVFLFFNIQANLLGGLIDDARGEVEACGDIFDLATLLHLPDDLLSDLFSLGFAASIVFDLHVEVE